MTSVCGHVMSIDFPGKFNNWDKVNITREKKLNLKNTFQGGPSRSFSLSNGKE